MAKKPAKRKTDYLRSTLRELMKLDIHCVEGIKVLCKGVGSPVDKVVLVKKQMKVGGQTYTFQFTELQWIAILNVVDQGAHEVLLEARNQLEQLSGIVFATEPVLFNYLTARAKPNLRARRKPYIIVGCCAFSDGPSKTYTYSQCMACGGTGWTPGPCDETVLAAGRATHGRGVGKAGRGSDADRQP